MVKPEDPEDMARAIIEIARLSDFEWRQMSDKALDIAVSYSWERATDLFERSLLLALKDN